MNYSKLIKKIRETLFMTQTEFAKMLGVTFETVNRWENQKFDPSMKIKKKLNDICIENNITLEEDTKWDTLEARQSF